MKKNAFPLVFSLIIFIADQVTKYLSNKELTTTLSFNYEYIIVLILLIFIVYFLIKSSKFSKLDLSFIWIIILSFISNLINNINIFSIGFYSYSVNFNIANFAVAISSLIMILSILLLDRSFKHNE